MFYFMYLRAILCTFQISVDFYYVPVGGRGGGLFWAQMALAALVPFKGPKKSRFLGPSPLKCPELRIVPPQNHFVPPHINNRCSAAQLVVRWLAVRQARDRISARNPREVPPTEPAAMKICIVTE